MTRVATRTLRGGIAMGKHRRGDGRVFQRGQRWWIAYYVRGSEHRESGGRTEGEATRRLRDRLHELHAGRFIGPQVERVTVDELLDAYVTNCLVRGKRNVRLIEVDGQKVPRGQIVSNLKGVRTAFGPERAIDLTAARLEIWVAEMLADGLAPGTVSLRVKYLHAALRLAHKQRRLAEVPHFPAVEVHNTREGFIEPEEFARVTDALPDPINDVARFAYVVGWRKQEILGLTWTMVDRAARTIRLLSNKTDRPRVIPMSAELVALIDRRFAARALTPWVFHDRGQRVRWITFQWNRACRALGYWRHDLGRPTKLFHDFRRTAYRNMIDAGVDPFTAMDIVGHRTTAMAKRYAIRSTTTMAEALAKTEAHLARTRTKGGQSERSPREISRG